ncbi:uncharacterized protein [Medicago truncatula]|uniref:uncharacterized protein n=1 Tax=Medicago truncatula TaxID=3880 RepID=UPI000D2F39E6|nr:uncharacterized protein LOC112420904 [Medicago truncatula]
MCTISVDCHYGGCFSRDWLISYTGGEVRRFEGLDPDKFSFFELCGYVEEDLSIKKGTYRLWWMPHYEVNYRVVKVDADVSEMKEYALKVNKPVNFFVEHDVDEVSRLVDVPNCVTVTNREVGQSSQVDVNGEGLEKEKVDKKGKCVLVCYDDEKLGSSEDESDGEYFDDIEHDRALGVDDGFGPYDITTLDMNEVVGMVGANGKEGGKGGAYEKGSKTKEKSKVEKEEDDYDPEWEREYESDELYSDDPDESDFERGPRAYVFKMSQLTPAFKFKVGMDFKSIVEFRMAIREWNVLNGYQIKFVKNDKERCRVECKDKHNGCKYEAHCSKVANSHTYKIKTLGVAHTCGRSLDNSSANANWLTNIVVEKMRGSGEQKVKDIMKDLRRQYSVGVSFHTAWSAKKRATEILDGDAKKQYTLLWRYAAELKRVCNGNNLKFNVERTLLTNQQRFSKFYFCFDGCKQGFLAGCRPFIGVDGCHLKTKFGGILLVDVGRDANDQYFPLAFGVVENETKETWRWFLTLLLEDIGNKRWVFISDQQKGLMSVFDEWSDRIEHRYLRHLYANFKKFFGGGTLIRDLMMSAAKATYRQAWVVKMEELKKVDVKAWEWLMGHDPKLWCKHAFSYYPKCDVLMNNISEAFNATILLARDKPVLTMAKWIRTYLMNRMSKLRNKLSNWQGDIMPMPRKRLNTEIQKSGNWIATWGIGDEFEVEMVGGGHKFTVNTANRTCSCNFWELVGIPCRHAVAAIGKRDGRP